MLHNTVSNSALSPSSSLSGIGWTASDPDNLLVLLKTFSLPFFLFKLNPFLCSSLSPIQSSFSSHKLPSLPLQTWLLLTLSCGLAPSSPLPLYKAHTFHPCLQHFWFLLPLLPFAPLPSCIRGHVLLNPSSMLFLLKLIAIHRKHKRRGLVLLQGPSGFPAMLAGCLPVLFWPALETLTDTKNTFTFKKCKP